MPENQKFTVNFCENYRLIDRYTVLAECAPSVFRVKTSCAVKFEAALVPFNQTR